MRSMRYNSIWCLSWQINASKYIIVSENAQHVTWTVGLVANLHLSGWDNAVGSAALCLENKFRALVAGFCFVDEGQ